MNNLLMSKKILWIFCIIAALAVIGILGAKYYAIKRSGAPSAEDSAKKAEEAKKSPSIEVHPISDSQSPERFPKDIPMESGAKVISNYNANLSDGRYQGTKVFETAKTPEENFALYKNYFTANGWTVFAGPTPKDQPKLKILLASKNNSQAQVTIGPDASGKTTLVTIVIVELAK